MAAAKPKKIVIEADRERPTKNKQRFKEDGDDDFISILYLRNKGDEKLGSPERIRITIEPA